MLPAATPPSGNEIISSWRPRNCRGYSILSGIDRCVCFRNLPSGFAAAGIDRATWAAPIVPAACLKNSLRFMPGVRIIYLRSEFLKVFLREVPTRMRAIHVSPQDEWIGRYLGKTKAFSGIVALGSCRERLAGATGWTTMRWLAERSRASSWVCRADDNRCI